MIVYCPSDSVETDFFYVLYIKVQHTDISNCLLLFYFQKIYFLKNLKTVKIVLL